MGHSGNADWDSRPREKSCSTLRAIFAENSTTLRSLLSVTLDVDPEDATYEVIPLSTQRSMLGWALRLHCADILDLLAQFLREAGGTPAAATRSRSYVSSAASSAVSKPQNKATVGRPYCKQ
jgi:hypothetical protein